MALSNQLIGKTALITGASSGFGAHFAAVLSDAGASVILAARRIGALQGVAAALRKRGAAVQTLPMDVADAASVERASEALATVDVLVNNAGIVRSGTALEQSEEDWDAVLDTNLKGTFFVARAAAKAMRTAKRAGSIINIASILGDRQAGGVLPYAASKAAVISLTQSLGLELIKKGIHVNAIAPGVVDTPMWNHVDSLFAKYENRPIGEKKRLVGEAVPFGRMGVPDDYRGPAVFLASSDSDYIVAQTLNVDGGNWMS